MAEISLRKVNKIYDGKVHAVHDLSLEIGAEDFIVLVGPSGCGKSTVLRMIAGLEEVSFGELRFDGELVNELPAKDRNVAMVFQNYALFPHLTVYENIAFRLKLQKTDRKEIKRRVEEAAEILGIKQLLTRKPAQLSGGQKQRVALGRAIVCQPRVFLLDEPLSNLDAKLRASMRSELIRLHEKLKTTFVYVTHDQTEALTMGTRIAVLRDGYLQQYDTPVQIYDHPANLFVATFMGSPPMNLFDADLAEEDGKLYAVLASGRLEIPKETMPRLKKYVGGRVVLGLRPEHLHLAETGGFEAVTETLETLGSNSYLHISAPARGETTVLLGGRERVESGISVHLVADMVYANYFDPVSERSLLAPPDRNRFPAHARLEGDDLIVEAGGHTLRAPLAEFVIDETSLGDVVLSLPAAGPDRGEGATLSLPALIGGVYPRASDEVILAEIEGLGSFVFSSGKGSYRAGEQVALTFSPVDLQLEDGEGERLLACHAVRGRMSRLSKHGKQLRILADECLGKRHLLYCGEPEAYVAVIVGADYPVYFKETARVEADLGTSR